MQIMRVGGEHGRGGGFLQSGSFLGITNSTLSASGWQSRFLCDLTPSPSEGKLAQNQLWLLRGPSAGSVTERPERAQPRTGASERPSPGPSALRRAGLRTPLRTGRRRPSPRTEGGGRALGVREERRGPGSHSHTSGISPRAAILGPHGNCLRGRRRSGAVRRCRKWGLSGPDFRPLCPPRTLWLAARRSLSRGSACGEERGPQAAFAGDVGPPRLGPGAGQLSGPPPPGAGPG